MMKTVKTLFTLSAIMALSSVIAQAETKVYDLNELTEGKAAGKLTINQNNQTACETPKCSDGIQARISELMQQIGQYCVGGTTCNLTLNDVEGCGNCEITIQKQ